MRRRREADGVDPLKHVGGAFNTTRWSIVCVAGDKKNPQSHAALDELCRTYWQPLYVYARRSGQPHHDAADTVQGFITNLIEKNNVGKADPLRGKFRCFLLKAFNHFIINDWRKAHTQKRGNGLPNPSIYDESVVSPDDPSLAQGLSPEQAFFLKWRCTLIEQAIARLGETLTDGIDRTIFHVFELQRAGKGKSVPKYAELARKIGISEQNVKTRMYRMRERLGKQIREEIRQTVSSEAELEEEINDLIRGGSGDL